MKRMHAESDYPDDWISIAQNTKVGVGLKCIRCKHKHDSETYHILTVHHMDGDKSNCRWWNLLALCQRCHLSIQARVNPETHYFLIHSAWIKPYIAGFYAWKYLNENLTRTEVESRLDELLALELRV